MKATRKQREHVSNLWYYSTLKQSKPNLVIKYTECGIPAKRYYFTIGVYSFNDFTGISHIEPLKNMETLSYNEIVNLLT